MDSRTTRIRSKLAKAPYLARGSHSVGAEGHRLRLGPRARTDRLDAFEHAHHIRMVIGNADGFRRPNVSSAHDFLGWYERWLDHMRDGKDNRALGLTSPWTVTHAPGGPRATARRAGRQLSAGGRV